MKRVGDKLRLVSSILLGLMLIASVLLVPSNPVWAAVETLRPDALGDECNIPSEIGCPVCNNHWQCVDEAVHDGWGTCIGTFGDVAWYRDLYNVANSGGWVGTINFVEVFAIVYSQGLNCGVKVAVKSGVTVGESAPVKPPTGSWQTVSNQWATNPDTGIAWTKAEIDTLQIGVAMNAPAGGAALIDCTQVYVEIDYTVIDLPTVTTQAATNVQATTATGNGTIVDVGVGNCDRRGIVWDLNTHGNPGNVAPGASGYANDVGTDGNFGAGAFTENLTGLPTGDVIYCRAYAHNADGWAYGAEVNFLTKPAPPTNVSATDGLSDKVVITWTKSTGATDYQVYRDGAGQGWLGDVATYDDNGADAGTISSAGTADASDGTFQAHVVLSLAGETIADGTTHTYKVRAKNATGESLDSATDTGYRTPQAFTYQWQRSAGDADAGYGNIAGATTDPYNDVGAPANGDGRWYRCIVSSVDASNSPQTSTSDRGFRGFIPDPPTNVSATDGVHLSKVVITWTKSPTATDYQVYRDGAGLGWLGDVDTYDDNGASAHTITTGATNATDGDYPDRVTLSLMGDSANPTTHTYTVKAKNAFGESGNSVADTGFRDVNALTYQWQRSSDNFDADYSNIAGATTDPYDDTDAPPKEERRFFKCIVSSIGASNSPQTSAPNQGYRAYGKADPIDIFQGKAYPFFAICVAMFVGVLALVARHGFAGLFLGILLMVVGVALLGAWINYF